MPPQAGTGKTRCSVFYQSFDGGMGSGPDLSAVDAGGLFSYRSSVQMKVFQKHAVSQGGISPGDATHLVLVGGLPGAGKTHAAERLQALGWTLYDDFQNQAVDDSGHFKDSRLYADLVLNLRAGCRCVVSDLRMVHKNYRKGAAEALLRDAVQVASELHLFENDPAQCAQNVRSAGYALRETLRLKEIKHWTRYFSAPPQAVLHPVWRPPHLAL